MPKRWEAPLRFVEDVLSTITIRDTCRTDDDKEDQSERISQEMALATFHLFVWVKSFFATHFRCFDALTIDNADTWLRVSICLDTDFST
jgi:hypothetical protein